MNAIEINKVKNGYWVRAIAGTNSYPNPQDIMVFESLKALIVWLQSNF